jgi:hypothetical protein
MSLDKNDPGICVRSCVMSVQYLPIRCSILKVIKV